MSKNSLIASFLLPVMLLVACANDEAVPSGSTVIVDPSTIEWQIPPRGDACVVDPNFYNDTTMNVSVLDESGAPLGDVDLTILVDLTGNTFSGAEVLKVYEDRNSNGVPDDPEELVSGDSSQAFTTETDKFGGFKRVIVRVNLSCPFRGNFYAYAGQVVGISNISVQELQP